MTSDLDAVLAAWKSGIDEHRPDDVAALFTEDAIFQGLHPYGVGRAAVAAYYAGQPVGLTVDYRILEIRRLAGDVVLGWVAADFTFPPSDGRPPFVSQLTVVVREGLIAHYHVSPRIAD